jgi:hypothetical protein
MKQGKVNNPINGQCNLINMFYLFFLFIHMCIHCLGHFFPLPSTPSLSPHLLPLSTMPSLPGKNCSALISNFVEKGI